jgi:regulator of protease activity HflC (stomatin/prohibitin superfamily)
MDIENQPPQPPEQPQPPEGDEAGPSRPALPAGFVMRTLGVVIAIPLVLLAGYLVWMWGFCRVYVSPGETLILKAQLGDENPNPAEMEVVPDGVKGIRERVYGEGRHFFNPITYERMSGEEVVEVNPGMIGLIESKSGKTLPPGEFIADEGFKGIRRKVLTPGKWRLNPYAFKVSPVAATIIEPGFVGCVTALSGTTPRSVKSAGETEDPAGEGRASRLAKPGERGIQPDVLQPGIYHINPREHKVDVVEIGYRQISFKGVQFPSKDGFDIKLDISVVWGLEPTNVPHIINDYGNVDDVVKKVIYPQVESICRIEGSKYGAKEFIEGKTREKFQNDFTSQLKEVCRVKKISVLIGLVREINVPKEVRTPIQKGKIAVEEKLTKEEQKTTQTVENELEELKADVRKGVREVEAETEKMVAEVRADGEKQVAEIDAETQVQVATIMLEVAKLDAEKKRLLGKAGAEVEELRQKAEADELTQNIAALGQPQDYARYIFARNLPEDIKIFLRYAGPGTFWTDLPVGAKNLEKMAAMKILEGANKKKK